MKNWCSKMKALGMMGAGALILSSCQPPEVEKVGAAPVVERGVTAAPKPVVQNAIKAKLPLARTITNSAGKQIEVTITGKSFDKIQFNRVADGKKYVLPISNLSIADQQFLTTVENSNTGNFDVTEQGGLTSVMAVKLKNAEKRLSRVIEDIEEIRAKKRSTTLTSSSPRLRGMNRDLGLLEEEKGELELEIANLKRSE